MKKFLLIVGLIIFVMPSLKALEKGEEYFLKSDISSYLRSTLNSKKSPFKTFDSTDYKKIIDLTQIEPLSAAQRYDNPIPKENIYVITKIKNKNNEQWVRICTKGAKKSKIDIFGRNYTYKCGWTNKVDEMILVSSVYSEIEQKLKIQSEKKLKNISLPDTPVMNSYCTGSGYDANRKPFNVKCYCQRKDDSSVYYIHPNFYPKNIDEICENKNGSVAISLKEYLKYGGKLNYSNYVSADYIFISK